MSDPTRETLGVSINRRCDCRRRGVHAVGRDSRRADAFGSSMFGGMQMTLTMTGWNGNANLGGLKLPNWLVVLAALGAAGAGWLKAQSIAEPHPAVRLALAGYGLAHACFMIVTLLASSQATLGIGAIVTAGAFGWRGKKAQNYFALIEFACAYFTFKRAGVFG